MKDLNNILIIENTTIFCKFKEIIFNSSNFQLTINENTINSNFKSFVLSNYINMYSFLIINNHKLFKLKDVGLYSSIYHNNDFELNFTYNSINIKNNFNKDDINNLILSLC